MCYIYQPVALTAAQRIQGGESRDLLRLMCSFIRTERVRKLFMIFLILIEFSCGKVQGFFFATRDHLSVLFYSIDFHTLLELV